MPAVARRHADWSSSETKSLEVVTILSAGTQARLATSFSGASQGRFYCGRFFGVVRVVNAAGE